MKYCICVSGNLGKIVLEHLMLKSLDISVILTDSHSIEIINLAKNKKIPLFKRNPRDHRASTFILEQGIVFHHILSINYLFILEKDFLNLAINSAVNFHGSLLPKYRGRTPHVWAIINGETVTGITAHLMNDKCDDGDIIRQLEIPIGPEDTGADLLGKYNTHYPELVENIIRDIEEDKLQLTPQNNYYATYFGKRTPEDGRINWNWQKERIKNWVRAQASPYPGAFSFINGDKIIINKIQYSDLGYEYTDPNGLVLENKDFPVIKTSNGAVELIDYCFDQEIIKGDILI